LTTVTLCVPEPSEVRRNCHRGGLSMSSSLSYRPRHPEQGVLSQIVRDHYETFRAHVEQARDGHGLPRFVAFLCEGRGFCSSCGGRRMTERAAHLVDYVFPDVPVRQWVLTLPSRVRYVLAWDHALCRAVIAVYVRAVLGWYRRQARMRGIADGRGGAVVIVQRFGSALNLNVQVHAMVLDGVFARDVAGVVRFHAVSPDAPPDLSTLLVTIARRIQQLLVRRGIADDSDGGDVDPFADDAPTLAGLAASSVRGVAALGPRAGRPVRRWGRIVCACPRTARWFWTCAGGGRMGRRSWCLIRSSSWSAWRRWCPGPASI